MAELNVANRTIFTHDNLQVLQGINDECIDLIYLDPPFNSGKQWHAPIGSDAEGASFPDIWGWETPSSPQETAEQNIKRQWLNAQHVGAPVRSVVETAEAARGSEMSAYLAFMAMRIVELHRILKPTGAMYLHCDPTASHYLKLMLDAVFGHERFQNEVIWGYRTQGVAMTRWPRKHDVLLVYGGQAMTFHPQMERIYYAKPFRHTEVDEEGRHYADVYVRDTWDDDPKTRALISQAKERTGFPTQKPLALLERIITASSNPGDVVLDPFCGCATACVAAEKLGRQWIGIDVSALAIDLCTNRIKSLQNETGQSNFGIPYSPPTQEHLPPARTDIDQGEEQEIDRRDPTIKATLYERQGGRCLNGCGRYIPPELADLMDLDRIVPGSKGGRYVWSNIQLLCRTCNVKKGNRSMGYLRRRLRQEAEEQSSTSTPTNGEEQRR